MVVVSSGIGGDNVGCSSSSIFTSCPCCCCSNFAFSAASFFFRVIAIIRQVRFSSRDPFGRVSLALVYSRHTDVARGSFLLSVEESLLSESWSRSKSLLLFVDDEVVLDLGFRGGKRESDNRAAATEGGEVKFVAVFLRSGLASFGSMLNDLWFMSIYK